MSYGFKPTSATGKAAVVPEGAENLLTTAFPTLNAEQRRAVLAATEIDSGEPLDASSNGYQRLNLAAAYSAKVTLSADGSVVKVEPGQAVASVVREGAPAKPGSSSGRSDATASTTKTIANTGSDMLAPAGMMVACFMLGIGSNADPPTRVRQQVGSPYGRPDLHSPIETATTPMSLQPVLQIHLLLFHEPLEQCGPHPAMRNPHRWHRRFAGSLCA